MTSVITKQRGRNRFYISSGWSKKSANKFVRENKKERLFATTLNANQTRKVKRLSHVTIPKIKRIKKSR